MSNADASIDFLSSVPSETLQASGPLGVVYDHQLQLARAERHLDWQREILYEQIEDEERRVHSLGNLTSPYERVENDPAVIAARVDVGYWTEVVRNSQEDVGGIVFLPAVTNLPEIEKRLASLNRKASKLGMSEITLTVSDERLLLNYKVSDEDTRGYDYEHVFAVLAGGTPQIPGFEFLATITTTEEGNVVKRIPTALESIDLSRFHHTGDVCEHCHTDRRRSDLYVVYNEKTCEAIQVGRTCLRDYMGSNDPERVLAVLEQVREFIRYASGSRGTIPAITTIDFLTHCATLLRSEGKSHIKGLGHQAAANYRNWLNQTRERQAPHAPLWVEPIPADTQAAEAILRWLKDWDETSEFATNVKLSLAGLAMNPKLYGYAGAAFIARNKWLEKAPMREEQAARDAANADKQYIGTIGERETFILTLTEIKWIDDRYGYGDDATKPMLIMADADGNEVKWFASNLPYAADTDMNPIVGGTYQVKATVKEHEDHERFGKSTVVNRAKFEKTINEPEDTDD